MNKLESYMRIRTILELAADQLTVIDGEINDDKDSELSERLMDLIFDGRHSLDLAIHKVNGLIALEKKFAGSK